MQLEIFEFLKFKAIKDSFYVTNDIVKFLSGNNKNVVVKALSKLRRLDCIEWIKVVVNSKQHYAYRYIEVENVRHSS